MKRYFIIFGFFVFFILSAPRAHAAVNGSLVKTASNPAVYYLADGKRYAFPNDKIFFSWYADFKSVTTVSATELASYTLAGNVTYRPGKWLVKIQTDPKVYAVSRYGTLRWVQSEEAATVLYGTNWPTKVQDIPDTFFTNYKIGAPITSAQEYSPQAELAITQISQNTPGTSPVTVNAHEKLEQDTAVLINQYRQSKGLSTLISNETIANAAREHSENMATGKVPFGHDGFAERVDNLRVTMTFSSAAENAASNQGFDDPVRTAVEGWLGSPGHLANIENASYNRTGIGIARNSDDAYYFTQIFIQGGGF